MVNQPASNSQLQSLKAAFCLREGTSRVKKCPFMSCELERFAKHVQKCLTSVLDSKHYNQARWLPPEGLR